MSAAGAADFARDWIAAWNSADIERILSHYASDIVMHSPIAAQRLGSGTVNGRDALRAYWTAALAQNPELHFERVETLTGHQSLTLLYKNQLGGLVAETLEFGDDGKARRAYACYAGG